MGSFKYCRMGNRLSGVPHSRNHHTGRTVKRRKNNNRQRKTAGHGLCRFHHGALIFSDFNIKPWSAWSWWLAASAVLMVLYELWWIRYFRSKRRLEDFYSSFAKVPLAGATLPVAAFFMLGIYGKIIWMLIAAAVLGIG